MKIHEDTSPGIKVFRLTIVTFEPVLITSLEDMLPTSGPLCSNASFFPTNRKKEGEVK